MTEAEEKSQELSHRVPHAHNEAPDNDSAPPFRIEDFERHRAEMKRETFWGRLVFVGVVVLLLVANIWATRASTLSVVENINWARVGQGSMEDDVSTQLHLMDARLKVLEEQNKRLLVALDEARLNPPPGFEPPHR